MAFVQKNGKHAPPNVAPKEKQDAQLAYSNIT